MIAALLHLHEGARPAGELRHQMRRRLPRRHDVRYRARRIRAPAISQQLLGIAQHAMHAGQRRPGLRRDLRRAAGDDDTRLRPVAMRATDRLPRLPLRLGRHRAGVDDDGVVQPAGQVAHHLALIGIEPAAKRQNIDSHAGKSSSSTVPS
jgi:hypothetical protein